MTDVQEVPVMWLLVGACFDADCYGLRSPRTQTEPTHFIDGQGMYIYDDGPDDSLMVDDMEQI